MRRAVRAPGALLLAALASAGVLACESAGPAADEGGGPSPSPSIASPGPPSPSPSAAPPTARIASLAGSSQNGTGPGAYRYQVEYPQLDGLGSRAQGLDVLIQTAMQRAVDDFVDLARAGAAAPDARSELDCRGRAVRLTGRLAVLRVDCTEADAGAGGPRDSTYTFNCDLAGARLLALQDLFRAGSAYLSAISDEARRQLGRLGAGDDRSLKDATAPVVASFRSFLLLPAALVIVFPAYRPPGAGRPEVSMPYATLERYLAPGVQDLAG
jgi:hypothetical protein